MGDTVRCRSHSRSRAHCSGQTRETVFTLIRTQSSLAFFLDGSGRTSRSSSSGSRCRLGLASVSCAAAVVAGEALDADGFNGCQLEAIHCFKIDGHNGWGQRLRRGGKFELEDVRGVFVGRAPFYSNDNDNNNSLNESTRSSVG